MPERATAFPLSRRGRPAESDPGTHLFAGHIFLAGTRLLRVNQTEALTASQGTPVSSQGECEMLGKRSVHSDHSRTERDKR